MTRTDAEPSAVTFADRTVTVVEMAAAKAPLTPTSSRRRTGSARRANEPDAFAISVHDLVLFRLCFGEGRTPTQQIAREKFQVDCFEKEIGTRGDPRESRLS